jgi:CRP-like cAMP-binding protein
VSVGPWHAHLHEDALAVTTLLRMRAGRRVVRGGEIGREVFILVSGTASVHDGETGEYLGTLRPGEVFGELSVLSGTPRRADVVANTDLEVLVMTPAEFSVLQTSVRDMAAAIERRVDELGRR